MAIEFAGEMGEWFYFESFHRMYLIVSLQPCEKSDEVALCPRTVAGALCGEKETIL